MTIRRVTTEDSYVTSDDEVFESKEEAETHERLSIALFVNPTMAKVACLRANMAELDEMRVRVIAWAKTEGIDRYLTEDTWSPSYPKCE